MSYKITFSDSAKEANGYYITVQDATVNTNDTSLTLVGRNYPGYGQAIEGDLVHMLENFANSSPPNNPIEGQLWYDSNNKKLKINDGTAGNANWYPVAGVHQQPNIPQNAQIGDIWVDTGNNQLNIFNGSAFTLIGPNYSSALRSGSYATTATDIYGATHNIVINYVNDNAVEVISQDSFTPNQIIDGFSTINSGVNLSGKNLGSLTSPSYAKFWGLASQASALQQTVPTVQTVSANNFVRNDIDQRLSGVLTLGNDTGLLIGEIPTFLLQKNSYNAVFLNSYDQGQGGNFTFKATKNSNNNTLMVLNGNSQRVGIYSAGAAVSDPTATLDVTGTLNVSQNLTAQANVYTTGSVFVSGNVYVGSTLTCRYEQILVGPLTIGQPLATPLVPLNTGTSILNPSQSANYDIGDTNALWRNIYAQTFVGRLSGTADKASKLIGPSTYTLSGHVVQTPSSTNSTDGTPGTYNLDTKIVGQAVYGQNYTSTTFVSDSVMIYRPTTQPDANVTGNGQLWKQSKSDFLQDLYAVALKTGAIVLFGQDTPISGWVMCDGSYYDHGAAGSTYYNLWSVIGFKYGQQGVSSFRVPTLHLPDLGNGAQINYYIKL